MMVLRTPRNGAVASLLLLAGCSISGDTAPSSTAAAQGAETKSATVTFGQQSVRQRGDLRVPAGEGPFPVAMLVHGGCYLGIGGPDSLTPMAEWLLAQGVASWTVSYRDLGSGIGYPDTFNDWAAALAKLKELAPENRLDLSRITVIGHSAGTTAATWLATGNRGDGVLKRDLPDVRAAVVLDGPVGMAEWIGIDKAVCGRSVIVPFMGGTPAEVPARYTLLDPRTTPLRIKELLVVDAALPTPAADALAAIRAQGAQVEVVTVAQDDHFNLLKPGHADFEAYAPSLLRIVRGK